MESAYRTWSEKSCVAKLVLKSENSRPLNKLLLSAMLSSAGRVSSFLVSRGARLLSLMPLTYSVASQFLSGLHVMWLILAAVLTRSKGSAIGTGLLKGIIEMLLSGSNVFALFLSSIEGLVAKTVIDAFQGTGSVLIYLAGGLSSQSNLIIVSLFFLPQLPPRVYAAMFAASIISALLFAGYISDQIVKALPTSLKSN
jgi:ABC-type thiamin/hydroxymethylpyrimidine transport system permease subunit